MKFIIDFFLIIFFNENTWGLLGTKVLEEKKLIRLQTLHTTQRVCLIMSLDFIFEAILSKIVNNNVEIIDDGIKKDSIRIKIYQDNFATVDHTAIVRIRR